jgi:membrane protein DedA with SNARE-associated domain
MKLGVFTLYTSIGAGLWVVVLTLAGYLLGEHQELLEGSLHLITLGCVGVALLFIFIYLRRQKRQS